MDVISTSTSSKARLNLELGNCPAATGVPSSTVARRPRVHSSTPKRLPWAKPAGAATVAARSGAYVRGLATSVTPEPGPAVVDTSGLRGSANQSASVSTGQPKPPSIGPASSCRFSACGLAQALADRRPWRPMGTGSPSRRPEHAGARSPCGYSRPMRIPVPGANSRYILDGATTRSPAKLPLPSMSPRSRGSSGGDLLCRKSLRRPPEMSSITSADRAIHCGYQPAT